MSALGLQDIIKTVSIIICIGPTDLRLRHIGKQTHSVAQSILLSLGPPHLLSSYWLKGHHHAPGTLTLLHSTDSELAKGRVQSEWVRGSVQRIIVKNP